MKEVIINGLSCNMIDDNGLEYPKDYDILSGGLQSEPTWEEYMDIFNEDFRAYMELVKLYVIENNLLKIKAYEICNDNIFSFSDGYKLGFSWRAWGDFMQAIVGEREGYMAYYV